jgi:hypothetical protein
MKMSDACELDFFEQICTVSKKDKETVRDILRSILMVTTANLYFDKTEIVIPYLCKLNIKYEDAIRINKKTSKCWSTTDISITAEPLTALIKEIVALNEGDDPESLQHLDNSIAMKMSQLLEVVDDGEEKK